MALWWAIRWGRTNWKACLLKPALPVGVFDPLWPCCFWCARLLHFNYVSPPSFIDSFKMCCGRPCCMRSWRHCSTVAYHHVAQCRGHGAAPVGAGAFIDRSLADEAAYAALQEADPRLASHRRATRRASGPRPVCGSNSIHCGTSRRACCMWIAAAMSTALFTSLLGQWLRGVAFVQAISLRAQRSVPALRYVTLYIPSDGFGPAPIGGLFGSCGVAVRAKQPRRTWPNSITVPTTSAFC